MTARLARALLVAGCLAASAPAAAAPGSPAPADAAPRADAPAAALERLRAANPGLRAVHRAGSPVPSVLSGIAVPTDGPDAERRAAGFIADHRALFGGAELRVERVRPRPERTLVALAQTHDGLPVLDHGASLTLDAEGRVIRITGEVRPLHHVDRARIDAEAATELALRHVTGASLAEPLPKLATLVTRGIVAVGGRGTEVFEVEMTRSPLAEHLVVRVDAHAGRVLGVQNRVVH